jgi:hypothetical protein
LAVGAANPSSPARSLLALGLLLGAGCGLGDYEKRVEEERARVQAFEEEDRALGVPLLMPDNPYAADEGKNHPMPQNEMFLRPPRGISSRPADEEKPIRAGDVFLFRYPGPEGYNLFLAGAAPGTLKTEQFQQDVRKALSEYVAQLTKQPLTFPPNAVLTGVVKPPPVSRTVKLPPIRLESQAVDDSAPDDKGHRYLLHFQRVAGNRQIAVIYQLPRAATTQANVTQAIDLSLRTLGIGLDAKLQHKVYEERKVYFPSNR